MRKIYVSTLNPFAYYNITSLLKAAGINFLSSIPGEKLDPEAIVLTTKKDFNLFKPKNALFLDELEEEPLLFKCQIYSRIIKVNKITLGIDPGKRIGIAIQLGDIYIGTKNLSSKKHLQKMIQKLTQRFQNYSIRIKIGNGDLSIAKKLLEIPSKESFQVELVNESGTSQKKIGSKMTKDQSAAAQILLKKGKVISDLGAC